MEELLKQLGIEGALIEGTDNVLTLDVKDSDEFAKIYSRLDNSELVSEDAESSMITYESEVVQYENDDYLITLLGDFDNDTYKLTIKEK